MHADFHFNIIGLFYSILVYSTLFYLFHFILSSFHLIFVFISPPKGFKLHWHDSPHLHFLGTISTPPSSRRSIRHKTGFGSRWVFPTCYRQDFGLPRPQGRCCGVIKADKFSFSSRDSHQNTSLYLQGKVLTRRGFFVPRGATVQHSRICAWKIANTFKKIRFYLSYFFSPSSLENGFGPNTFIYLYLMIISAEGFHFQSALHFMENFVFGVC